MYSSTFRLPYEVAMGEAPDAEKDLKPKKKQSSKKEKKATKEE